MPAKKHTAISLFSGAMGLDLGVDATNRYSLLACLEREKVFCETMRLNQRAGRMSSRTRIIESDIRRVDADQLREDLGLKKGELDLLLGGPPCQSFSTAGRRGSVQDPRGSLLWEFLRFVEAFEPKFFVMENVRGLLSSAIVHRPIAQRPEKGGMPLHPEETPGSVVRLFAEDLKRIGGGAYHMDAFEVNAVNYGAPQLRERALFIGNRLGLDVVFPDPTHGAPGTGLKTWTTLRSAIGRLRERNPVVMDFSPRKKAYLKMVPPGGNWRALPVSVQKESMGRAFFAKGGRSGWWRRLSYDLPCPTLVTMPNHASTSLCHPTALRALSIKEYARIQEFPRDWEFAGTTAQQYTQVGNAVPTRLGLVAGRVVSKALSSISRGKGKTPRPDGEFRVIYVHSHVRTRRWFANGEAVAEKQLSVQNTPVVRQLPTRRSRPMAPPAPPQLALPIPYVGTG